VSTSTEPLPKDENGRTVYTLKKPIPNGSETVAELRFRPAVAKDLRAFPLEGRTVGHILDVVAKLCGQPPHVIDQLSAEDLQEVSSIAGIF
jgi:Phage tail assembly chaperone proteins, E, or 41 or 14